jgi:hypothetical protein
VLQEGGWSWLMLAAGGHRVSSADDNGGCFSVAVPFHSPLSWLAVAGGFIGFVFRLLFLLVVVC